MRHYFIPQFKANLWDIMEEVKRAPFEPVPDGAGAARGPGTKEGWINGLEIAALFRPGMPDIRRNFPFLMSTCKFLARNEGQTIQQVMLNKIYPGCGLGKHRDGEPAMSRWHLPIWTHASVTWWDEIEGEIHMLPGMWWGPVNYCGVLHQMDNPSKIERIHMIVDME